MPTLTGHLAISTSSLRVQQVAAGGALFDGTGGAPGSHRDKGDPDRPLGGSDDFGKSVVGLATDVEGSGLSPEVPIFKNAPKVEVRVIDVHGLSESERRPPPIVDPHKVGRKVPHRSSPMPPRRR